MAADHDSSTPRRSWLDIADSFIEAAERMSPAKQEHYLNALLAHINQLLASCPSTPAAPAFVRPADDSQPDGADDLTRWLEKQFQHAA